MYNKRWKFWKIRVVSYNNYKLNNLNLMIYEWYDSVGKMFKKKEDEGEEERN